jgi:hypothetical protein
METTMRHFVLALATTAALSTPTMAQTMDVILQTLTFPEDTVVPSTKGCSDNAPASGCQTRE